MTGMELIRHRRSVRTFDGNPLRPEDAEKIIAYANGIQTPYGIKIQWKLLSAKENGLSVPVVVGTDTYIAGKIPRLPHSEEAFGYAFEKLVLYAESLGIGTTWIAGTMNRPAFEKAIDLHENEVMPCISPLGYPADKMSLRETMMRKGVKADSRLDFPDLFFDQDFDHPLAENTPWREALEMVRWAPSAVNRQPWRVVINRNLAHFYEKKSKGYVDATGWDLQKVDMGIALYHFAYALDEKVKLIVTDPGLLLPEEITYMLPWWRRKRKREYFRVKTDEKHKTRRILIVTAVILALVLGGGLFWGENYLVSFAIGRYTGTGNVAPESTLSEETTQEIMQNWQLQAKQAEDWLAASEVETVQILSEDGLALNGEVVFTDHSSHFWVVSVHGYRGNHSHMRAPASYFGLRGYNALLPDLRGCGDSEGDYIGMGWPDRKDMLRWIEWIIQQDSDAQIVLHGISMGGATVMMTAGDALPVQVKAIVEDCGYTSVWDIFADELSYLFHLPVFPVLNIASRISSLRAGYSFTEASALKQIAKTKVPMLFIHGSEDNFVHTDMVYQVYEACPTEKQLFVVEGAGHGNSYNLAPEAYFQTVFGFLSKYVTE
ncbi:MAG: alpha/beta fold hydrolase [Clostridia bacterium]|nr:alpha/beta fold hydrolase [Clostridia bacterium]MBQ9252152.1 alpha/beta fold hydrolase [Clostridia bacterium]